jgi:hypothetical protein
MHIVDLDNNCRQYQYRRTPRQDHHETAKSNGTTAKTALRPGDAQWL